MDEITNAQRMWWNEQKKALGNVSLEQAYREVPLDEVIAYADKLETQYSKWWIKKGNSQSRLVTRIKNGLEEAGGRWNFAKGKANRMAGLGFSIGTSLGLFTLIADNQKAMANIAKHNPEQQACFQLFVHRYEHALEQKIVNGSVGLAVAHLLKDSFIGYLRSLELDDGVVSKIGIAIEFYLETNPGI